MAVHRRVKLASHIDDVRRWVDKGNSDEWIASALGTTPSSVQSFRSRQGIYRMAAPDVVPDTTGAEGFEGTLEHDEGVGLWFDPAVGDLETWARRWSGVSGVIVKVSASRIVIVPE